MSTHQSEVVSGERFKFGENWARFLEYLNEDRIEKSMSALRSWLGRDSLEGLSFIDIGSGSGLSSLAAYRLGAVVYSFDYDPTSVECTRYLRSTFANNSERWNVGSGSVLDEKFLESLGQFDIVYSWGVLHHTGEMWQALGNVAPLVKKDGTLFVAIYNDQGPWSRRWKIIKRFYNKLPKPLAVVFASIVMGSRELKFATGATIRLKPIDYVRTWTNYGSASSRGMSKFHDLIDWIGGYPFEVAKPEEIFDFYFRKGFSMKKMETCGGGLGCNQFVFVRKAGL
jgi:2-polyprenyl-3-methyl-5-hydroxy-6-metoxy-1,4-benzoquinol methylase